MHEEFFREEILLRIVTGTGIDGSGIYRDVPAKALVIEEVHGPGPDGSLQNRTVFLIKSDTAPQAGTVIVRCGRTYVIGTVKTRYRFDGSVEGYYCIAAS